MKQKRRKVWLCLIGILSCAILMVNNQVLAATPSYHAYSGGVIRGTIRYVSQSTSTASANGWGAYASKANGECGYASQSMALSYIGKDISPEYLCHGEYAQGKWHTGYGKGISGTYEINGISVVSGSGNPSGITAVNTINSMLTNFINDNGRGQYSPVVIHYAASSSVMHAIIVIGKESNGNYLTLDPARGMNVISMTLSSSGAVGGNVTYATRGCKINGVQQYYNAATPQLTGNNPFGYLDRVTAEMGKITVHGWAADMDAPNNPIEVHFYTVQDEKRVWLGAVTASEYRSDIRKSYPDINEFHGFTATFDTGLSGNVKVEAYGINVGSSGSNAMLWDSPKTVSVPKDTISPTISNVEISDISSSGYTVTCDVSDNIGLSSVQFPTWSHTNGQDDLVWHEGTISGNKATCRINVSDHKEYVNCTYQTDIYAYDYAGNCTSYINALFPYIDATSPTISDVEVVDVSETGYTVKCKVTDDHSKIARVQFPTWFEEDNPFNADWSWKTSATYSGKLEDGKYVFRVNTNKYKNKTGKYHTDIYAWDEYGNQSKCYTTETIITKAHKHEYISSIKKPATCTEPGIRLYTCKDNDDSYEEEIPATGHQHTELRNIKAATCAQEGYTGDTYCKDCNTKLATGKSIAKKDHTWDSGKVTTVATCSGKGIKTYTCTGCNATRTEEIPPTGHQYTELRNVKAATCAQEGYTGDTYCKDCDTKLASGKVLPKTDHIWDTGKVTQNATCTAKGIKTFTCTVCKSTRIEEIPVTGHVNKITKFAKEASCKSEGYTGDIYCQDCGKLLEEGQVIPKADHVWNKGEITTPATCTTKGIKTYTCASCGTTKTEAIAATGHGATEIRNKKDATTTSEGYTGDTYCTICNQKISSGNTIAKLTPQTATLGKMIKDKSTNGVYKVLQDGVSVEFTKPVYKKASVRIPDTIKVNGITCKVTGISANAFKNNKSLKSVTIGRNVTVIGTNAFYGCKKLSKVSGGNGIVKIGHRAFANCISLSKITIPGSVRSIGKQAFCNCKKLSSITIKTSTLSGKTVGSKAFAGTYKKPTVKVPAKQMKAYKKLLKARGMSSKAVYRK